MIDALRICLRLVWEIIPIAMPWRNMIIIPIMIILLFWIIFRAFPWIVAKTSILLLILTEFLVATLLLPDYLFTNNRRKKGLQVYSMSYIMGDLLSYPVKVVHLLSSKLQNILTYIFTKKWFPRNVFLIVPTITILIAYYISPSSKIWFYSLENWIIGEACQIIVTSTAPKKFVQDYFNLLKDNQYKRAYDCLSLKYKNRKTLRYHGYLSWWDEKVRKFNINVTRIVSQNSSSAIVDVRLQFLRRDRKKFSDSENIRLYLIWDKQNRTWLIDDSSEV